MPQRRHVQVRRIYDDPVPNDGTRVLVDRIWPRGMTKAAAHVDEWCKQMPRPLIAHLVSARPGLVR
jgi:uncharacterized protein YeaO (DUF488 family)